MAEARGRENWIRTSTILAMIANTNRDPKKSRPFKPSDFDPYSDDRRRDAKVESVDMATLKSMLLRAGVKG